MRRTSTRKAAVNKAKLLKSIRPTEERLCMRLMESLEMRTLFSVLPNPVVGTPIKLPGQSAATDATPSVAIDLNNPQYMVAVWQVDTDFIKGAFSINGGASWSGLSGLPTAAGARLRDPNIQNGSGNGLLYQHSDGPSVGFDRNDQAYVVFRETSTDGNSGAVILKRYSFSNPLQPATQVQLGVSGGQASTNKIVYQWIGDDAVAPMVAVDNNVLSSTDTDSQGNPYTQTDDLAADPTNAVPGNVYIAWMTNDTAPNQAPNDYNPNTIRMIASSDGGNSFSSSVLMNDFEHTNGSGNGASRPTKPRMVVSQGNKTTPGGQVTIVWDDINPGQATSNVNNVDSIMVDTQPQGGVGAEGLFTTGPITDAVQMPGTPTPPPTITPTGFDVDMSTINGGAGVDPRFQTLTDVDLTIAIRHTSLADLSATLQAPNGGPIITLFNAGDLTGSNMGIAPNNASVGTTFDDDAARAVDDTTAGTRIGHFRPTADLMSALNGLTRTQVNGDWILTITDGKVGTAGSLVFAKLTLTSRMNTVANQLTPDVNATQLVLQNGLYVAGTFNNGTLVRGSTSNSYPKKPGESPDVGVGPNVSIASDNTLGAYSAHQGRLYISYLDHDFLLANNRKSDDTRVYLLYSDDFGVTWKQVFNPTTGLPDPVARDTQYEDGYTQGLRPQFEPEVAVDQATGTVVVQYYDARRDAAEVRVTTDVATSNDGGQTFSKGVYVNDSQQVFDAITGDLVNLAPLPDNGGNANPDADAGIGFGDRQGLAVYMGHIQSVWTSNINGGTISNVDNRGNLDIRTNSALIPTGPLVSEGTQGAVGEVGDPLNSQHAADGTPQLSNFVITFDRPVDIATFDGTDVTVEYRNVTTAGTDPATKVIDSTNSTITVTPLNALNGTATQFQVTIPPQTAVGTYSYIIGPNIGDHILTYAGGALVNPTGNQMDQTPDGSTGGFDDVYTDNGSGTNLPLIIPGPHILPELTQVPGQAKTTDNLVLNSKAGSIDVTFDRDMDDSTITAADVLGIVGPNGPVSGPFSITLSPNNANAAHHRTYRIGFPSQSLSGSYVVYLGAHMASNAGDELDRNLNAGLDELRSVPSKDKVSISYNSADAPTIAKNSVTTSTIHITDTYALISATLQLSINFPNDPDLSAVLIAPDNTTIPLFTNVGNNGVNKANFNNTVFDDLATTPIASGGAPFFGHFNPQFPLANLTKNGKILPANGDWKLQITNSSGVNTGQLLSWKLTLVKPISVSGIGEDVADQTSIPFRIFTMDKTNSQSANQWTPLGPNNGNTSAGAGRVSSIAVDPSDPSGNTVYVAGSGGGVWKTTNFLTHDSLGPTYIPLTDFGPNAGLSIGSIAVFARNNDPAQSVIFAATGDGNLGATGVGFLRSMDGGKTWVVLDSKANFDAQGNLLPIANRKHDFVGTTSFKILVDPHLSTTGDVIVYAALSDGTTQTGGGIWRSTDTGRNWTQVLAGNATDVTFDYNSVSPGSNTLTTLFAGMRGQGVFITSNRGDRWDLMAGGIGDPLIQQANTLGTPPVPVIDPPSTPQSGTGRIVLAKPALVQTNGAPNVAENLAYEGWLYAAVGDADGTLHGLYVTKDFGQNWTRVQLPNQETLFGFVNFGPTNDNGMPDYDVTHAPNGRTETRGADYAMTLAVDPNNPNIIYMGGSNDRRYAGPGFIRIDISGLADPHAEVVFDNSRPDGGALETSTTGRADESDTTRATPEVFVAGSSPGTAFPLLNFPFTAQFINLIRNPDSPFDGGAVLQVTNLKQFNNDGTGASYIPFDRIIDPRTGLFPRGENVVTSSVIGSNQHALLTMLDPATGLSRLLIGTDQGIYSMVDDHGQFFRRSESTFEDPLLNPIQLDGTMPISSLNPINPSDPIQGPRNGNLQLAQLNFGAVAPSSLGNQLAEIYGSTEGIAVPRSAPDILTTGNTVWAPDATNPLGKAVGVAVSQQDPAVTGKNPDFYAYYYPSSVSSPADFFQVNGVTRTFGLIQDSQQGQVPDPQWPYNSNPPGNSPPAPGNFTVNPLNGDQIMISSVPSNDPPVSGPHVFATEDQGRHWFVIANPSDLDGSYARVLTYGAPDPNGPGGGGALNAYLFAGTQNGHIFVTFTGGSGWKQTSGLDGSPIMGIVANPVRGTHDAYAVTQTGVYHMLDTRAANPTWIAINGNLKQIMHNIFGNPAQTEAAVKTLSAMVADWRYTIPDLPGLANSPTHPVLYVGATTGVYRSTDNGASWQLFPNQAADGSAADGGLLPNVPINDLDLSLGYINTTTGQPNVSTGDDLLVASTGGRGAYGIRVAPLSVNLGLTTGGNVATTDTPTITGYSEQTAFGNKVHVKLYDITDPANRIFIGEGDTDGSGKFTIQVNTPLAAGVRTLAAQAADDAGLTGPDGKFNVTIPGNVLPKISINDVTQNEGNSGTSLFTFNVTLDKSSGSTITVNYSTADNTATTADGDYTAKTNQTLTFLAGETSKQVQITVNGDTKVEPNESFFVNLSNATNASIADSQGVGTITNDDVVAGVPSIAINNVSKNEGNSGTTAFTFDVTLSSSSATPVTVNYATADGTATAGSDYTAISTTALTFAPGETSKQITVSVSGDTTVEPDETFFVNLSGASANSTIGTAQGKGTIVNDDGGGATSISINDVTKNEGNSGNTPFTFTVSLSSASASPVTVNYATANGSALSTSDYQAITTTTLTFNPGETTKQITVNVNGDTLVESDEDFFVNLSGVSANATIADNQGEGTILNDDGGGPVTPSISINDVSKAEGNSGTTAFTFNVTLSSSSASPVTVNYATADGTATAGSDYTGISSTALTFAAGETSKQITVNVTGDTAVEPDETFFVNLSGVSANATIADNQGQGTITNDDVAQGGPTISINDVIASEGTNPLNYKPFLFTLTLSSASATPVTVNFATADGTATAADDDYIPMTGTVTFAAGQTSKQISIPVTGDAKVEGNETFFVNLSGASANASVSDAQGMATVNNDDVALPTLSINNVTKKEGNSGTTTFTFTVTLSKSSTSNVTVKYASANGTASSSSDYTSKSGTLTFTPGQISKTISISVKGDTTQESDELFFLNLTSPTNATIADPQGVGTIQNDDKTTSSKVGTITDPTDSTKTALQIFGTSSADTITVDQVGTGQGKAKVTINGSNKGTFSFTGSIVVFGQDGNDKITIASGITRSAYVFGGFGNDSITGGGGADVLEGEAGNDSITGGAGRDILIGGDGTDKMDGGADDDVLMPGDFVNNYSFSNLAGLNKEWVRTDADYPTRSNHIMYGGGLNSTLLNKLTCFSSVALKDSVTGGTGMDLFLVAVDGDMITDPQPGEIITDIGI